MKMFYRRQGLHPSILISVGIGIVAVGLLVARVPTQAACGSHQGGGWIWSDNSGWISLNCANPEAPSSTDFGVDISLDTGALSGWAWSDNVGWVCFGTTCSGVPGLGAAPDATPTDYDVSSGLMRGWANVITLGTNGWVKLRDTSSVSTGKPYDRCYDCNPTTKACSFCFASNLQSGSGKFCSSCTNCTSGSPWTCNGATAACASCYPYGGGIGKAPSGTDYGSWVGWVWNGFQNGSSAQRGLGWTQLHAANATFYFPWVKSESGDIYAEGTVGASTDYPGKYNSTYLLHTASGTISHWSSETGSSTPQTEQSYPQSYPIPRRSSNYTTPLGRIDWSGIYAGQYGIISSSSASDIPSVLGGSKLLNGGVYRFSSSVNPDPTYTTNTPMQFVNGVGTQSGAGLIIVEGNLQINGNLSYEASPIATGIHNLPSLAIVVRKKANGNGGNVTISPSVTALVGVIYAEGTIDTGNSSTNQLVHNGTMIAGKFLFKRSYSSPSGSERIIFDGRALVNTPPGLGDMLRSLPAWQEVTP